MAWRSCAALLRLSGDDVLRSSVRGGRWPHSVQQRCGFRKAARKPETRKVEEELGPSHTESSEAAPPRRTSTPYWEQQAPPSSPRSFGRLVRPLLFTVGFTGCSFGVAAIWQYESLKFQVQSYFDAIRDNWLLNLRGQKRGDVRQEINQWWHGLSSGQKTVVGIVAANAVVLCCWRFPPLHHFMVKYFTSNPASKTLCTPMLLSTFSHFSFFHMAANMLVLCSFSTSADMLGTEQFMAVYLSAGVISSFASYVYKTATGRFRPSLGASGAVMAVVAAVCVFMPEAKLGIFFLPMYTFTAANALKAVVAMDVAGVVFGWRLFDHAAHLGGAFFGIWYALYGQELIWKNRKKLVQVWHDLRTGGGPGGGAGGSV